MSEGNGKGTPWPDESTPFDEEVGGLPAIAEHTNICSQIRMLWQVTKQEAGELRNCYLAIRHARTAIGPGILDDIASAIEMRLTGAHETVAMLREQAAKMRAAQVP